MESIRCSRAGLGAICEIALLLVLTAATGHAQTQLWNLTGSMATARVLHTATLLPGGNVLVVGGLTNCNPFCSPTSTVEIYDPAAGTWRSTARMKLPRANHAAVLLPSGK